MRVSTRIISPSSMKSGTCTSTPDSSVAGLLPPPEAVSPLRPGSVLATFASIALATYPVRVEEDGISVLLTGVGGD